MMHYIMPGRACCRCTALQTRAGQKSGIRSQESGTRDLKKSFAHSPLFPGGRGAGGEGAADDVTLFFGLSGTGKTTLSADPHRRLIGDDEHCWSDNGIFNIEGGCYAKCIHLSQQRSRKFGRHSLRHRAGKHRLQRGKPRGGLRDASITRTRGLVSDRIHRQRQSAVRRRPSAKHHFSDVRCVRRLPPVSRLTPEQAMYHFISGYTARVAGTEDG